MACHAGRPGANEPATSPTVVSTEPTPAPQASEVPRRPTYDEYIASLFDSGDTAPPPSPQERRPEHLRFPQEVAGARSRARAALGEAGLGHLQLSETMYPVREGHQHVTWRFALMDPAPCEGACRQSDEGEQVGWLLATLDGEVAVESLGHRFSLADFSTVRAREKRMARELARLPVMVSFCRWVTQQGAEACTMWIEEAPAPDCVRSCQWQAYVGASNGVTSSRHFTLLIDERFGALSVRELDGSVETMARYRARLGF